ncbi:GntR family transcriptional regulator [Bacillus sp. FJAT-50079]|uniref:GntR family transcriptional regulator n=1 Tax=Bacillus sp. FJAT-50079 TaxID=2833577 RepID=UPI001BC99EEB|nr:GntR family transcriptional regulator [Bacillus sp. FJAT-50079]MBS4210147.1 GntR family transcriptional regulator [Bacillus sp. FJAT-50079]
MKAFVIDKQSKLPLHFQIYEDIKGKIESKKLQAGDKIPSEKELQTLYDVSRITVRRAIHDLENEGFVKKSQGKGTIVCSTKQKYDLKRLSSFSEDVKEHGEISSSIIREFKIVKADHKTAYSLGILEGEEVYYLERSRLSGDTVVGLHKAFIKKTDEISLDRLEFDETTSLYERLKMKGIQLKYANEILEAQMPDKEIKKGLGMKDNIPIFFKERITYDTSGVPIEFVKMYYRSDVYQYKVTLDVNDGSKNL